MYQTLILLKNRSCCETFNAFVAYVYDLFSYLSSLKDQKQRNNCLGNLNWLADGLKVSKNCVISVFSYCILDYWKKSIEIQFSCFWYKINSLVDA